MPKKNTTEHDKLIEADLAGCPDMAFYYLDGKIPKPCSFEEFSDKRDTDNIVRQTQLGPFFISTVFLRMDHGLGTGSPLLFETMVFEGGTDTALGKSTEMRRCSTWDEAELQHEAVLLLMRKFVVPSFEPEEVMRPSPDNAIERDIEL